MQITDTKISLDERLNALITDIENPTLQSAVHYALFPGGKRLRPQMLLSITGSVGLDAAAAIELVHTYTLIHDDLPAMDNDDFRRGKPSLHKAFDEATAILTGDLLLTLAFEVLSNALLPSPLIVELTRILSKYIGANGIISGQMRDISQKNNTWEEYQQIALQKTADLFIATLIMGARIKSLPESDITLYTQFGQTFGLLYQIKDDLEDNEAPLLNLSDTKNLLTLHAKHLLANLSTPNPFLMSLL